MEPALEQLKTEEVTVAKAGPRRSRVDWFVVLLCVILGALMVTPSVVSLVFHEQGNTALAHAKAARLAAKTVSLQCYGSGQTFADQTTDSGFAPEIYDEIVLLAKTPGEVYLRRVGSNGYDILVMEYTEGAYTVLYNAEQGQWTVSYFQAILTPTPVHTHDA